jgi:death-on-curing protein
MEPVFLTIAELLAIHHNHPFIDGNKRVGAAAAVVFLALNDVDFDASEDEFEALVMAGAKGETSKKECDRRFFRRHLHLQD